MSDSEHSESPTAPVATSYGQHFFKTACQRNAPQCALDTVISKLHKRLLEPDVEKALATGGSVQTHVDLEPHEARYLQEGEGAVQSVRRGLRFADDALIDFSLYLHGMPPAKSEGKGRLPADPRGPCVEIWIERVDAQVDVRGGATVFHKVLPEAQVMFEGNEPVEDIPDSYTRMGDGLAMVLETGRRVRDFPAADWYLARAYQHLYSGLSTEEEVQAAFREDPGFARFVKRMLEHPTWSGLRWGHGPVLEDVACELRDLANQHSATETDSVSAPTAELCFDAAQASPPSNSESPQDLQPPPTTPRLDSPAHAASPGRAGSPPPWPWIHRQTQTHSESDSPSQGHWMNLLGPNAH